MAMVGVSVPIWRSRLWGAVSEARWMASMASADIPAMQRMIAGNIAVARENVRAELTRLSAIQKDILPRAACGHERHRRLRRRTGTDANRPRFRA